MLLFGNMSMMPLIPGNDSQLSSKSKKANASIAIETPNLGVSLDLISKANPLSVAELAKTNQLAPSQIKHWIESLQAPFLSRFEQTDRAGDSDASRSDSRLKRQREFQQGRRSAHSLLEQLGCLKHVGVNIDRSPEWPLGFAGSISHSQHWMWTVAGIKSQLLSVGIDTEPVVGRETRRELSTEIASDAEWRLLRGMGLDAQQQFSIVFAAKEAFYKCCHPIVKQYFGFEHAVVDEVSPATLRLRTRPTHPCFESMPTILDVHFLVTSTDVLAATWMEPQQ